MIYHITKRILDVAGSSMLLILFLPFWIIIPILIKLDSPGSVIFRHRRLGKNRLPFDMFKFRSMVEGAHDILHNHNPELLKKFKDGDWKLEHDPRITKLGKILRSITIDEFPQLINVLKGDMSLVGPRAYMKEEVKEQLKKYPQVRPLMDTIFTIKPGITGPWQIAGRNEVPFNQRVRLDYMYATKKDILYDIYIVLKTPQAMFSKW